MFDRWRARGACVVTLTLVSAAALSACRDRTQSEVEVEVRSVGFDPASNAPVVVLQDRDRTVALPIWIGPSEAQAIAMQMDGVSAPRPMTHDLIKEILDQAGIEFRKAVIQSLKDNTYYARIYLRAGDRDLQIDSRPSDAIALAVRFHRPIFVAASLLKGDGSIDLEHAAPAASTMRISGVTVQNLTAELAEYFRVPAGHGVLVAQVAPEAPVGLQRGDLILEVEGKAVSGVGNFVAAVRAVKSGQPAHLTVQRGTARLTVAFVPRTG
jgi:uncharacterized protein